MAGARAIKDSTLIVFLGFSIKEILNNYLKKNYDYVIIDSPAGIESGFEHAIIKADIALIIVNLEISSVHDADRVIGIIDAKSFKTQDGSEVEKYLVLNRVKMDLVEKGDMLSMEDVENILALPTIGKPFLE